MAGAGRPVHPFISENFTRVDKKDNQSNRWLYNCDFCDDDHTPGCNIKHQDNKLFNHIINSQACPNATPEARCQAQVILMGKGKIIASNSVLSSLNELGTSTAPGSEAQLKVTAVGKKRKAGGSMDHFVDRPLSEQEEADANVLFFRFEIMYLSYLKSLRTYTRI